jgi:hypothetical protein
MATVTTREQLKDYCLRRLGAPVIEINIDDEQIEDRIDDAFQFYRDYHYDAVEMVYLKHQFTTQDLTNQYILFSIFESINPSSDSYLDIRGALTGVES